MPRRLCSRRRPCRCLRVCVASVRKELSWNDCFWAVTAAAVTAAVVVGVYYGSATADARVVQAVMEASAASLVERMRLVFEPLLDVLETTVVALSEITPVLNISSWDSMKKPLKGALRNAVSFGYIEILNGSADLAAWEQRMSTEYLQPVVLKSPTTNAPAPPASQYWASSYSANATAATTLFRDIYESPPRRETGLAATSVSGPAASSPVQLLSNGNLGYTIMVPVRYRGGPITAFFSLGIDAHAAMSVVTGNFTTAYAVTIDDTTDDTIVTTLFVSGDAVPPVAGLTTVKLTYTFLKRVWQVQVSPAAGLITNNFSAGQNTAWAIGVPLTIFSGLTALGLSICWRRARRVEATKLIVSASEKTHDHVMSFICHELRNPLHCAFGLIDELREDSLPAAGISATVAKALSGLTSLETQLSGIGRVLNSVLDSQQVARGVATVLLAHTDIQAIVRDVCQHHRSALSERARLAVTIADGTPQHIVSDSMRISQVLSSLVSFACRSAAAGYIHITASPIAASVLLTVTFTGTPILSGGDALEADVFDAQRKRAAGESSGEDTTPTTDSTPRVVGLASLERSLRHKAAEVFAALPLRSVEKTNTVTFQLHAVETPHMEPQVATDVARILTTFGKVSSLPACAAIAGALSGHIGVYELSGCTRFWLVLPSLTVPEGKRERGYPQSPKDPTSAVLDPGARALGKMPSVKGIVSSGGARIAPAPASGSNPDSPLTTRATPDAQPTVILVDDEMTLRRLGARMLTRLNISAKTLEDGSELPSFLCEMSAPPTLILLDIVMKRSDGVAVCKDLRLNGVTYPIFAMTGNVDPSSVATYKNSGFSGLLAKPFGQGDVERLLQFVEEGGEGFWSSLEHGVLSTAITGEISQALPTEAAAM